MAAPRSLVLHDALAAAFNAQRWADVRALYHDEALLCTVATNHEILRPDELMDVFAGLDQTAYTIGREQTVEPIDDQAIIVMASLRYHDSFGIAHGQKCWLLTFKDDLVFRSSDFPSNAAARAAYAEHGIHLGIDEHS